MPLPIQNLPILLPCHLNLSKDFMASSPYEKSYSNVRILTIIKSNTKSFNIALRAKLCQLFSYIFQNQILNIQIQDRVILQKIKLLSTYARNTFNKAIKITYSTILGCFKFFSKDISLIAVEGTPSSSFSSLIFLMATVSPVSVLIALYTTP